MADDLEFPNYDHHHQPSMHNIDPEPYIDPATPEEILSLSPSPPPRHASPLGLSGHSPAWYLTRIQKYSTYAFSAFAVMHITNTSLIPLLTRSVPASEPYLLLTRPYYQSPAAEPLMIALPLWSHILSGLALRAYRRNQNAQRYGESGSKANKKAFFTQFWPRVSGISKLGFFFSPLLLGHMFTNRAIPKFYSKGANVGLDYVSHAFARHPVISYAGFAALLTVGVFHVTWGWAKWLGWTPEMVVDTGYQRESRKKRRQYTINGIAVAVTGLWMAGSFGVVARGGEAPGWVARQYDEMYRMIPILGRWM